MPQIDSKGRFTSGETKPLKERFDEKISFEGDCWVWTGYKNRGYGYIHNGSRPHPAYRVAWELYRGTIPEGLVVRHRCPQRRKDCCNPDHLKIGTQKQNMEDAIEDGTILRGEERHLSKLTESDVEDILLGFPHLKGYNYQYMREKASQYGVSVNTIADIFYGRSWKHISGL